MDRYAYGLGNPLKYSDPTGHWADEGCGQGPVCDLPNSADIGGGDRDGRISGDTGPNSNHEYPQSPDPNFMIPLETGGICPSTYTYVQCLYYGGVFKPGADIQIDLDRFNELLIAILFDLRNRAPVAGYDFDTRRLYDTPLWDMFEGGDACFGDACYARHEVNYVAQGMYVAASDQELAEGVAGVFAWKACNFVGCLPEVRPYRGHYPSFVPSGASLYWLSVGYNIFNTLQSSYPR